MPATELALSTRQPLLWGDLPELARGPKGLRRTAAVKQRNHRADAAMIAALADPEKTLFLDVETTGLSHYYDRITLVGYASRGRYGVYVEGDAVDELFEMLAEASTLVTFNGTIFDIPFLKRRFANLRLPRRHVDLRYASKRASLTGG